MSETTGRFEIYRDAAKEWRWRLVAANGRIVADSGEGYTRRSFAAKAAYRIYSFRNVEIVYLSPARNRKRGSK